MSDFYEFDEEEHQKKNRKRNYIIIALVFLLIGLATAYALYPLIPRGDVASTESKPGDSLQNEDSEAVVNDNNSEKADDNSLLPTISNEDLSNENNPLVDLIANAEQSVVGITSTSEVEVPDIFWNITRTEEVEGTGSGIIISKDGYVLTNNHVIENANQLFVIMNDGSKIDAELVGTDPYSDVAVLKMTGDYSDDLVPAKIGDSDKVKKGEFVITIGNPLGHELAGTANLGIVSNINRELTISNKTLNYIQTDAAINQGNSGGALVNMNGEVIGMNTAKIGGELVEGLGFAIPSNTFEPLAKELLETGEVKQPEEPWLGISYREVTDEMSDDYGYPKGILVADVLSDSPAANAGVLPGDVIVDFDDKEIETSDQLTSALKGKKVGDVVEVDLWRKNMEFTLKIKIGDKNEAQQQAQE